MQERQDQRSRAAAFFFWGTLVALIAFCLTARFAGDILSPIRWVIFGPRYLIAVPFALLAIHVGFSRSLRQAACLALVAAGCTLLILDFRAGMGREEASQSDIRVMSLNVRVASENHELVHELVEMHEPDIVALQETTSDSYALPAEYDFYDYGELTFGTRYRVISTPQHEYSFRGAVSGLVLLKRPLEPSFFASRNDLSSISAERRIQPIERPIRPATEVSSTGPRQFELESRYKAGFSLAVTVKPADASGGIEYLFDFGTGKNGGAAYRDGDSLMVGTWRGPEKRWLELEFPSVDSFELCLTVSDKRTGVYIDGKPTGSFPSTTANLHGNIAIGTFADTSRTRLYRFFPHRRTRFVLEVDGGLLEFTNIHNPTPRHALSGSTGEDYRSFIMKCGIVARQTHSNADEKLPQIVAGDFNLPVESRLYRTLWGGYQNAFSSVGFGLGRTKETEFGGLTYGSRIDHILVNDRLRPISADVLGDVGSDHRPIIADLRIKQH